MLDYLLKQFSGYRKTCSITRLQERSVSFIRDESYLEYLKNVKEDVWIIAPKYLEQKIKDLQECYCPTVNVYYSENSELDFVLYHNKINENVNKGSVHIGSNCNIHESAIIGSEGLKLINAPNGEKIQFIHIGNVIIHDNVNIGPHSVINRGLIGVTTIGSGTKIGTDCVVGYNCHVGQDNVLAPGTIFNGGVYTGKNCWFGSRTVVKHYIKIEDNIAFGMSSVVTKNIKNSGIYIGNPAKFLKPMDNDWTFWR